MMNININKKILMRILNDDIESELQEIISDELSKPLSEIDVSKIDDCTEAILIINNGDNI